MRTRTSVLALAAVLALPLAGCEKSSWSSRCTQDLGASTCTIKMGGSKFRDFPVPYARSQGTRSADKIRLVSATKGGEAVIQGGGQESRCTQGSSYQVQDTTITCDVVEDDYVELSTTRPA